MKTVANNINQTIVDSHHDIIIDAYRNEKHQRIEFLSVLWPFYIDLLRAGNDKGGAVSIITSLLREVRKSLQVPSVNEYVLAAESVAEVQDGVLSHLGIQSVFDIEANTYQGIRRLIRELKQTSKVEPVQEEASWEGITASLYESIAQAYTKAAKELRNL